MRSLLRELGVKRWQIAIAATVIVIWLAAIISSGAGWNPFPVTWDFSRPGAFGDSFGPLNTLMATIAALGAIAAYKIQSDELRRSRDRQAEQDEIAMSDRARGVSRELDLDRRAEKAAFETTFFHLIDAFRAIVADVDLRTKKGATVTAHDAFRLMCKAYDERVSFEGLTARESWLGTANEYRNDLNHYFRFLYHIIKFLHDSSVKDKYFYVRFVRASLSESELKLIALNCEFGEGREKFKDLVEEYSLLHNLHERSLPGIDLAKVYEPRAFNQPSTAVPATKRLRKRRVA